MPGKTKGGASDAPPPSASSLSESADWRSTWGGNAYDGEAAVAAAILDADVDDRLADLGADDPRPGHALEGIKPGEWQPDENGLPPGCPVLPLGTEDGTFFFLDTIGQLRALNEGEMGQAGLNALFMGRHYWLYWAFPKRNSAGDVTSWRPEKVREMLMAACAKKGAWSAADRVRGRGVWTGRKGALIIHCGDRLIDGDGEVELGELDGMVYPTRPPIARPWPTSLKGRPGPMLRLLPFYRTWNWTRPELDPVLLTGWTGIAWLSGALDWRPACDVLGDKGTGKTTLQRAVRGLFGVGGMIRSSDATKAGISQKLKFDCLPVALDEFEATKNPRKERDILDLMRISASGDEILRGGDNHKGTEFAGRSAFLFSQVNMPALEPTELSRMAILTLKKLKPGQERVIITDQEIAELGRKVMRRMMDGWPRWKETLERWSAFLASCGHDARSQDTFGALMTAADILIGEDADALGLSLSMNGEDFEPWREHLAIEKLGEIDEDNANWRKCLSHIMSQRIEAWRGGTRHTVGQVLVEFFESDQTNPTLDAGGCSSLLEQTGLKLLQPKDTGLKNYEFFVPIHHPLVNELMRGSKWQGELGSGAWTGALRQAEDEGGRPIWREASARIHGEKKKGTAFALIDIIAKEDGT